MLKKIISIFLLAVLLFSSAGGLLLFKIQQQVNYKHIKKQLLSSQNLTTLKLSVIAYEQSKADKCEIKVNGKMYDVQHVDTANDSVTVYCIADEKEDLLIEWYQNLEKKKSDKSDTNTQFFKFLSLVYLQSKPLNTSPAFIQTETHFSNYCQVFKPTVLDLESPPPKLV